MCTLQVLQYFAFILSPACLRTSIWFHSLLTLCCLLVLTDMVFMRTTMKLVFILIVSASAQWGFNGQAGPSDYDGAVGAAQRQYQENVANYRYDTQGTFSNPNHGYDNSQRTFSHNDYARMAERLWNEL